MPNDKSKSFGTLKVWCRAMYEAALCGIYEPQPAETEREQCNHVTLQFLLRLTVIILMGPTLSKRNGPINVVVIIGIRAFAGILLLLCGQTMK